MYQAHVSLAFNYSSRQDDKFDDMQDQVEVASSIYGDDSELCEPSYRERLARHAGNSRLMDDVLQTVDDSSLYETDVDADGNVRAMVLGSSLNARDTAVLLLTHASASGEGLSTSDAEFVRRLLTDEARVEASGAIALAHSLQMYSGMLDATQYCSFAKSRRARKSKITARSTAKHELDSAVH